ncbi:MAG TPA: carbamoyltransferase [Anaerolineae bacterium]|nr:carbamoyltransferase [Anaerolineae bacterium]
MNILGVSCYYHDAAAALLQDGMLIAAAEEERFSRVKHDSNFPKHSIEFCLKQGGITANNLDYVVFYEKPLVKFERILMTTLGQFPRSYPVFRESMITWFNEKLWIKSQLQNDIGVPANRILFIEHHLSHAASALFASPFDEAAILTIDGVGEWTTATIGKGTADWNRSDGEKRENKIDLIREVKFPHSLGLLYSAFTAWLGFQVNEGEYKVMGMAPYGTPKYVDDVYKLVEVNDDGSFKLNMDYFSFHYSTHSTYNRKFSDLFGESRRPESEFFTTITNPKKDHPHWSDAAAAVNQHYADVAASIQHVTEEMILKMAGYAHQETGSQNLVMAGGVALNSVANGRVIKETPFENVFIQPAAGDSGGALGAALYAYHVLLGKPRKFVMEHAYWGQEYSVDEMRSAIEAKGFAYDLIEDDEKLLDQVVDRLTHAKVVSWFRGRFEWGPRALGHRSILADPRSIEMKEVVNTKIKFREPFRPFAPVILEERTTEYFDIPTPEKYYPARYMLLVTSIPENKRDKIQAVCHVDGSGRLQTVRREWNPSYYRVVEKFGEATGVPVLLNTSYNLRGEPIVTTPQNALYTFGKSDIDALVMGQFLVKKN